MNNSSINFSLRQQFCHGMEELVVSVRAAACPIRRVVDDDDVCSDGSGWC